VQQLLLPGKKEAAAAALQGLQEKQQQLQQALRAALWRLSEAHKQDVDTADLVDKQPPESFDASTIDSAQRQGEVVQTLHVEAAAQLVGPKLLKLLREFCCALWSVLPQPCCCNNPACANLGSISEAKLVSAKGSRCSKCQVAR
jgi:hypothetical protein